MKFGSLFTGIGGIDLGLERAGMECAWQVEINPFCLKVLVKHWPDIDKYKDIKEITELPYVDLICGGFPCQPISHSGSKKGQEDERWLWPEFERIICLVRPRYVFVENVPGLLHRGMGKVLGGLARSRYDAEWESIPASTFGAPHRRDRVYILAYSNSAHSTRGGIPIRAISETPNYRLDNWWETEPGMDRVADGIPDRVDRLRSLGNAVVPQVAEWIGRRIMEFENV